MGKEKTRRRKRGEVKRKEGEGEEMEGRERRSLSPQKHLFMSTPNSFHLET